MYIRNAVKEQAGRKLLPEMRPGLDKFIVHAGFLHLARLFDVNFLCEGCVS